MKITDPTEFYFYTLFLTWKNHSTQIDRLVCVLELIGAGIEDKVYTKLARYSRRRDGESYISKNNLWMEGRYKELREGWYLFDVLNREQKLNILEGLIKLKYSRAFVNCVDDFVSIKPIEHYMPSQEYFENWTPPVEFSEQFQ